MDVQFSDLALPTLRALAGNVGAPHPALPDRATVSQALVAHNPLFDDNLPVAAIQAPALRDLCTMLGLPNNGVRAVMAARLRDNDNPVDRAVQPLDNPRGFDVPRLASLDCLTTFHNWDRSIRTVAGARGIWDNLAQSHRLGHALPHAPNARQRQLLDLLKEAVWSSLGKALQQRLGPQITSGAVPDEAGVIAAWCHAELLQLGTAHEQRAEKLFEQSNWKGSGKDLADWVASLYDLAAQAGQVAFPLGAPLENKVRQKIFANVADTNPDAGHVIRLHRPDPVTNMNRSVQHLVADLTKAFVNKGHTGEQQCEFYCVEVVDSDTQHALLAETKAKLAVKEKEIQGLRNNNKNLKDQQHAFYAFNKGGGGGGKGDWKNKNYRGGGGGGGGGKGGGGKGNNDFCHCCHDYYKAAGKLDEKYNAIRSHATKDCKFKQAAGGKDREKNKNGGGGGEAKKSLDKQKKRRPFR